MTTNKCTVDWCDLEKYRIDFGIDVNLIESCQALNLALCALSQMLSNDHILSNFAPHFIPFQQYAGIFPSDIPEDIFNRMKKIFTEKTLPSIILQEDHNFSLPTTCAVYGAYRGRENEVEENTIWLNKQIIECSTYARNRNDVIKYAAMILFTIVHELGHWAFHHFACQMDHDLATPKGVLMEEAGEAIEFLIFGFRMQHYGPEEPTFMIDEIVTFFNKSHRIIPEQYLNHLFQSSTYQNVTSRSSLTIPIQTLLDADILDEQSKKFSLKRVFNSMDEPKFVPPEVHAGENKNRKRVFASNDKQNRIYC